MGKFLVILLRVISMMDKERGGKKRNMCGMFCNIWLEWEERDSVDEGSGGAKKEDIR